MVKPHLTPWITAGVALVGAGTIAVTPVSAPLPDASVSRLIQLVNADVTIDLVRHGLSEDNAQGIIGTVAPGAPLTGTEGDTSLTTGWGQAAYLANAGNPQHLADPSSYGGIFASGLIRTQETAAGWLDAAGAPNTPVTDLSGLNELNAGILEGAPQNDLTGLMYLAAPLAWTLGLYFVPELGSSDYNGMAFENRYGDAIQTIYGDTPANGESVGFSHAAAIMIWTQMNVNNPNPLLILEHPLSNTGQVIIEGSPTDGWTMESWDGIPVAPPNLLQDLFVNTRDLIVAPQMAAFGIQQGLLQSLGTLSLNPLLGAIQTGVTDVVRAILNYPGAMIGDIIGAIQGNVPLGLGAVSGLGGLDGDLAALLPGGLGGLEGDLAALLPGGLTDLTGALPGDLGALIGDIFTAI